MERDLNIKATNKTLEFAQLIPKLSPAQLIGLAKWLGVKILTENVDPETKKAIPREAMDIIEDCIIHFNDLDRATRRALIKQIQAEVKHGTRTKNS